MPSDTIVLMGGGIDSTALVHYLISRGHKVSGLHFDYGQPAAEGEKMAIKSIAAHYGFQVEFRHLAGPIRRKGYEFKCRNALLVLSAAASAGITVKGIGIAIHKGTDYYDCSREFCDNLQRILDGYFDGCLQLKAPFLSLNKSDIIRFCVAKGVPTSLTFSCEVGPIVPCGRCPSCRDREMHNAIE